MNSTLKSGIAILVLAIIFLILAIFIFPVLFVAMTFGGSAEGMVFSGLLTLIFFILAIIFMIIGPILIILGFIKEPKNVTVTQNQQTIYSNRRCPKCGRIIPLDAVICPFCKHDFEEKNINEKKQGFCPKCGVKLDGTPKFCYKCGVKLK